MIKNPEAETPKVRKGIGEDEGWLIENERQDRDSKFQEYKSLKLKQAGEEPLTAEEFEEMVNLEIEQELAGNPGLEGVFSPEEELEKIRHLPATDKRAALDDWKNKYYRQKEAITEMSILLENTLLFNNDTPRERLDEIVQIFAENYGFSGKQLKITQEMIARYYETRQEVLKASRQFPDDIELVRHVTGVDPEDAVRVSIGAMSVDIEASDLDTNRMHQTLGDSTWDPKLVAFAGSLSHKNGIPFTATSYDKVSAAAQPDEFLLRNHLHEAEHHKNALFRKAFEKGLPFGERIFGDNIFMGTDDEPVFAYNFPSARKRYGIDNSISTIMRQRIKYSKQRPRVKKRMLDDLLGHELRQAFRRAKDEWTAKMQNNSAQKRAENFEHTFRAEGPYDFFSKFRNRVENASENQYQNDAIFKEKMGLGLKEIEKTYQEQAKKSAEAFVELVNSGFSQEEAVAFLQDKDFEDWPKTVRRLKAFQAKNRA